MLVALRNASLITMSSLAFLVGAGCAERHQAIPSTARLVAEDQGKLDFVAPSDGEVFVEDDSNNKLLYSGKIEEGERLAVDPMKDRLSIDGRIVRDQKIRDLNNLRVFFLADPRANGAGSRTIVVPAQPAQPAEPTHRDSGDAEILIHPRSGATDADTIRVTPGANADSTVTVEPGEDGSKVTIERAVK